MPVVCPQLREGGGLIPDSDLTRITDADDVPALMAHNFRRWYARISSTLLRTVGTRELDAVEDAVQDALLAALQHWPYRGIPHQPEAWLYQVARRKLFSHFAGIATAKRAEPIILAAVANDIPTRWSIEGASTSALGDDKLTMMFLVAHPSLTSDAPITLLLRTLCGLTVPEIAAALLRPERTVAQRIVRAKRTLLSLHEPFAMPGDDEMRARLDGVLHAIDLLFNEGYAATRGDSTVRHELCAEAIRLALAIAASHVGATPKVLALCALLELQSSRLNARERADGTAVPLMQQDRNRCERPAVSRGLHWLARAAAGDTISDYHLQAAIAAEHALTIDNAARNWRRIRHHYEQLMERTSSPIV